MLGYIVRKQPTWLHRVAQHQLIKDLLRLLKTETDVVVLVPSLLVLVSLLPAVAAKMGNILTELFEVFSRLCTFKWKDSSHMSDLSCTHLTVAIYAYFQRLYGMFPCNFLSYMRQQYLDTSLSTGSSVFADIISPLLATVRLHPLLVTQNREHEKTTIRWKGLAEVHDVVAECSRYSLDVYESASREDLGLLSLWPLASDSHTPLLTPGQGMARNNNWSPSINHTNLSVLSPKQTVTEKKAKPTLNTKLVLDSPPEAAVEATPDNTPYATPVKDSPLRHQSNTSRPGPNTHVKSLSFKSPGPASPTKLVTSPTKEPSPFRFPDPSERRDSLFSEVPSTALSKRDSLGLGLPNLSSLTNRMRSIATDRAEAESSNEYHEDINRPSPVKFTAQPQLQISPVKPSAENLGARYNMDRAKLLSLPLDSGDPTKEDMDAEVSSITGSAGEKRSLSTRHITPHMFPDSAGGSSCTSRAMSRLSAGSPKDFLEPDSVCSGTPSSFQPSVDELVKKVRTRVRCITLCEPSDLPPTPTTVPKRTALRKLSRSSSCPNVAPIDYDFEMRNSFSSTQKEKSNLRFTIATQTENELAILPYEHLFPSALPSSASPVPQPPPIPPPQELLDDYIKAAVEDNLNKSQKDLKGQLKLLRSQLQFETGRREVLGARNRRLLGYTKNVRELEEQNLALVDQLHMVQQEIATLHTQLATVRNGKHQAETERAEAGKLQDKMIQELQAKVQELTTSNRELTEKFELKEMTALEALASCDKARSELFQAQAKLDIFRKKEENWKVSEVELNNSKKKLVLQGELIEMQREKLETIPKAGKAEEIRILQQAAAHEVATVKADILHKSQELTAAHAKIAELEARNATLEEGINNQKDVVQSLHEEHKEKLEAVEMRQKAIRSINIHLESTIMELQVFFVIYKCLR